MRKKRDLHDLGSAKAIFLALETDQNFGEIRAQVPPLTDKCLP